MENDGEIRSALKRSGNVKELYRVYEYEGWRNEQLLVIRILDSGPDCDNPGIRYSCIVTTEDGSPEAQGNPAESINAAITGVHWDDLDRGQ